MSETMAVEIHDAKAVQTSPATVADLLHYGIEKNVPVETMERLVALHERVTAQAAAREFADKLAEFQRECPPVAHNAVAKFPTNGGKEMKYTYAELDHVASTVREPLHARGFSYTWDIRVEGAMLTCVCTLRHNNGHFTTSAFTCPTESKSAASPQQKYAAAATFAQRRSLITVLGITTAETDTDGANPAKISEDHAIEIMERVRDSGGNPAKFLKYMGVDRYDEIRAVDIDKAVQAVESYEKKARERAEAAT